MKVNNSSFHIVDHRPVLPARSLQLDSVLAELLPRRAHRYVYITFVHHLLPEYIPVGILHTLQFSLK